MPSASTADLSQLLAHPPYGGTVAEQQRWLRRVMLHLSIQGQPLAERAGLAASTINRFLSDKARYRLRPRTLDAIAETAGSLAAAALPHVGNAHRHGRVVMLPCLALASFAQASTQSPSRTAALPFNGSLLTELTATDPSRHAVAVHDGESMVPLVDRGDVLLVDRACRRLSGDGLYLLLQRGGGSVLLRRVTLDPADDTAWIGVDNPRYAGPRRLSVHDLQVLGRVLWIGKRV